MAPTRALMVKARPARKVAASAPRNHAGTRREACAGPRDPAPGPQYRTTQPSTVRRHGARGEGWRGCSGSVWVSKVRALELRLGVRDPNQLYLASTGPGARLGGLGAPCGGQLLHGATSCFVEQHLQTDTRVKKSGGSVWVLIVDRDLNADTKVLRVPWHAHHVGIGQRGGGGDARCVRASNAPAAAP